MANNFFYGQQEVSSKGKANYVYINTRVDTYQGDPKGYSITLGFPEKDTKALTKKLEALLVSAKESEWGQEKQWVGEGNIPPSEDAEGNSFFKFKSSKKDKAGQWTKVELVDSKNNPLPENTNIGSGSLVRAIFTPAVYHLSKKNFGVTLFVDKLQVVELKEYSGGAGSNLSFPEEDGYVAKVDFPTEDDSECPI